jgi:hypothetical protein
VNSVLGSTPLHVAVEEGKLPVVNLLFKYQHNKVSLQREISEETR